MISPRVLPGLVLFAAAAVCQPTPTITVSGVGGKRGARSVRQVTALRIEHAN